MKNIYLKALMEVMDLVRQSYWIHELKNSDWVCLMDDFQNKERKIEYALSVPFFSCQYGWMFNVQGLRYTYIQNCLDRILSCHL